MEINQAKREKFMEYAGKRVNNVLHDMQILEPMARSASYDFTRQDVDEMFAAMQETLNNVKAEFEKKFEEKARSEKKVFSFGKSAITTTETITTEKLETVAETINEEVAITTENVATLADYVVSTVSDTF